MSVQESEKRNALSELLRLSKDQWIQFGSVMVALVALIWQQGWQIAEEKKRDDRLGLKLELYKICATKDPVPEDDLIEQQKRKGISEGECRKALYEMVSEGTIRWFTAQQGYKKTSFGPPKGGPNKNGGKDMKEEKEEEE